MPRRPKDSPPREPHEIIDDQARRIERLEEDLKRSEIERNRLRRENERLKEELEMARRRANRQAAPFSRGLPKEHPQRPGRKPGTAYGRKAHRRPPPHRVAVPRRSAGATARRVRVSRGRRPVPAVSPPRAGASSAADVRRAWVYAIQDGRGFAQAARMLGADDAGVLQRDGWAPYRQFVHAAHQTCLAHLLRRCRPMMRDHPSHPVAPQVQALLQAALATRDRHRTGRVSDQGLAVARGHYINRLDRLLPARPRRLADARRFAAHLRTEFETVFSFLFAPTLDATNWRAEHALRPAGITRKRCGGGNRPTRGAQTQQVLTSLLRTAQQRGVNPTDALTTLLRAPGPVVLDGFQSAPVH